MAVRAWCAVVRGVAEGPADITYCVACRRTVGLVWDGAVDGGFGWCLVREEV